MMEFGLALFYFIFWVLCLVAGKKWAEVFCSPEIQEGWFLTNWGKVQQVWQFWVFFHLDVNEMIKLCLTNFARFGYWEIELLLRNGTLLNWNFGSWQTEKRRKWWSFNWLFWEERKLRPILFQKTNGTEAKAELLGTSMLET